MNIADRVAAASARYVPPPSVTPAEFAAIACNRCGHCCEDIPAPESPVELAALLRHPDTDGDTKAFNTGLEAVGPIPGGWRYRCTHVRRDDEGAAVCGIYDERPGICRRFPTGPVRRWPECSWYVLIAGSESSVPVTLTSGPREAPVAPAVQAFYDELPAPERAVLDAILRRAAEHVAEHTASGLPVSQRAETEGHGPESTQPTTGIALARSASERPDSRSS